MEEEKGKSFRVGRGGRGGYQQEDERPRRGGMSRGTKTDVYRPK